MLPHNAHAEDVVAFLEQLRRALGRYRRVKEWVWAQEESQNMGGWSFLEPRLRALGPPFEYVGLPCSKFAVAGAGTGKTPCAIFAVPPPTFSAEHANFSMPSA